MGGRGLNALELLRSPHESLFLIPGKVRTTRIGSALLDCYKRLPTVLAAHAGTIRILHTLTPLGVAMAGANEFDPYKD